LLTNHIDCTKQQEYKDYDQYDKEKWNKQHVQASLIHYSIF